MQQRTPEFDQAIREDHFSVVEAEVFRRGQSLGAIPVLGGDWTDDRFASVRRRCSLSLPALPELIPTKDWKADNGLWPVGNEVQLRVGVQYDDGSTESVPAGRYRLTRPTLQDTGVDITLTVEGYDRSRVVSRNRFTKPYAVRKGTDYATAIKALIKSRIPTLAETDYRFIMTTNGSSGGRSFSTPDLLFTNNDDPWTKATEMAESIGAELFFDSLGRIVLRAVQDVANAPVVWDYAEGDGTNLLTVDRSLDDETAYNGVIVDSSNTQLPKPIHAEYWDTDPSSPTYYDPSSPSFSTYGAVPYFMNTEYITTQAQANQAARSNFDKVSGISEQVAFSAIVHPAHESGDVVSISRARANVNDIYIMDSIRCGLGYTGTMDVATRTRRAS